MTPAMILSQLVYFYTDEVAPRHELAAWHTSELDEIDTEEYFTVT